MGNRSRRPRLRRPQRGCQARASGPAGARPRGATGGKRGLRRQVQVPKELSRTLPADGGGLDTECRRARDRPERPRSRQGPGRTRRVRDVDSTRLQIVDAAAGELRAGDLPSLAEASGLVIVPDHAGRPRRPEHLEGHEDQEQEPERPAGTRLHVQRVLDHRPSASTVSGPISRASAGTAPARRRSPSSTRASRRPGRLRRPRRAQVNMTSLPVTRPATAAATAPSSRASRPGRAEARGRRADGRARLDRRDGRPGHGAHERRDRGRPLDPREQGQYNIRVANFSLHRRPEQLPLDPLDKAVEKLWFSGVVVVAAAGNYGHATAPSGVITRPATTRS